MENSILVIFLGFILIVIIGYSTILYTNSNIHKERDVPVPAPPKPTPNPCNPKNIVELKKYLKNALLAIRYNIKTIKEKRILQYRPEIMLSMYPFYTTVLKLPKYIKANPCYGRNELLQAMHEIYGPEPEKSYMLHVKRAYANYYIVIDLFEAMEYYEKYHEEGIDDII